MRIENGAILEIAVDSSSTAAARARIGAKVGALRARRVAGEAAGVVKEELRV